MCLFIVHVQPTCLSLVQVGERTNMAEQNVHYFKFTVKQQETARAQTFVLIWLHIIILLTAIRLQCFFGNDTKYQVA